MSIDKYIDTVMQGDVLEQMALLPDESVDCIITSPPYYQCRNYGWNGQWGLEERWEDYLLHLGQFMSAAKRVLKKNGSCWVNLGDTFGTVLGNMRNKWGNSKENMYANEQMNVVQSKNIHKCLMLLPHRFAIQSIDNGWILRNTIIWQKPNGMPESVTDRFSKKHEYIFFFVKNEKYYFDLDGIRQPLKTNVMSRNKASEIYGSGSGSAQFSEGVRQWGDIEKGKNPGDCSDLWSITTKPSSKNHYASFNSELIDKPIICGCPPNGIILDPFCGTGTTLARAKQLGRKIIGIEGKAEYVKIAQESIAINQQLF